MCGSCGSYSPGCNPAGPVCCTRSCCRYPGKYICCRQPWNISRPRTARYVDFCVAPLACRSLRYDCWLTNFGPKVDTNLGPSLYSSRVENAGHHMVDVRPPVECGCAAPPCPCHF